MIGNDIVDLFDEDSAPREDQQRFDARVFGAAERSRIASSADPQRERWRIWAAKEAAYKAGRRMDPALVFSPRRFRVSAEEDRVIHDDLEFELSIEERAGCVHAVARRSESEGPIVARVMALPAQEAADPSLVSRRVREFCCAEVADVLGTSTDDLRIDTEDRVPELRLPSGARLPVSLSHHGSWVAFALRAPFAVRPAMGDTN